MKARLTAVAFLTNAIGTALLLNHFSIMKTAGITREAAIYVLGITISFAVVGVAAALSGGIFGAALQKPPVLLFFFGKGLNHPDRRHGPLYQGIDRALALACRGSCRVDAATHD